MQCYSSVIVVGVHSNRRGVSPDDSVAHSTRSANVSVLCWWTEGGKREEEEEGVRMFEFPTWPKWSPLSSTVSGPMFIPPSPPLHRQKQEDCI